MDTFERLEHFKDYKYMKQNQEDDIKQKEAIVHACDDKNLPDSLKRRLFQNMQEAKRKLIEICMEELREGQELESILNEYVPDDRVRYILNARYIQQKSLLEVSEEVSLCYKYTSMLTTKGKRMLKKAVIE